MKKKSNKHLHPILKHDESLDGFQAKREHTTVSPNSKKSK